METPRVRVLRRFLRQGRGEAHDQHHFAAVRAAVPEILRAGVPALRSSRELSLDVEAIHGHGDGHDAGIWVSQEVLSRHVRRHGASCDHSSCDEDVLVRRRDVVHSICVGDEHAVGVWGLARGSEGVRGDVRGATDRWGFNDV